MKNIIKKIQTFLLNSDGLVSVSFSLLFPILTLVVIGSVDYAGSFHKRQRYQQQFDSVLLQTLWKVGADASMDDLKNVLDQQLPEASITKFEVENRNNGRVYLSATLNVPFPMVSASLLGKSLPAFTLTSEVSGIQKLSGIEFVPTFASGYYPKMVELVIKRSGEEEKVINRIYYKVKPLGTVCRTMNSMQIESCGEVELGEFEYAYLRFSIWEYLAYNVDSTTTPRTTEILSNDPDNAYRLFIDGVQQMNGTSVNVFSSLACGEEANHAWEDMRYVRLGDSRDFIYDVRGFCRTVDPLDIRLTQ